MDCNILRRRLWKLRPIGWSELSCFPLVPQAALGAAFWDCGASDRLSQRDGGAGDLVFVEKVDAGLEIARRVGFCDGLQPLGVFVLKFDRARNDQMHRECARVALRTIRSSPKIDCCRAGTTRGESTHDRRMSPSDQASSIDYVLKPAPVRAVCPGGPRILFADCHLLRVSFFLIQGLHRIRCTIFA